MENNPNKKYDHVYVILRYDTFIELGGTRVSVLKVFVNEKDAKQEINRLNNLEMKRESLQKGKNLISSTYSYQIGRIKKGELCTRSKDCYKQCPIDTFIQRCKNPLNSNTK